MATNGVANGFSNGVPNGVGNGVTNGFTNGTRHGSGVEVICGPLLNYKGMIDAESGRPTWQGSVIIVTKPSDHQPTLHLRKLREETIMEEGTEAKEGTADPTSRPFAGTKLYQDPHKAFFAFQIELQLGPAPTRWEYYIPDSTYTAASFATNDRAKQNFVVPAASESMNILFHSCNGFSLGTDMEVYKGPTLWNDVLRHHEKKPFHVMIGGGDQIYNDNVRTEGPLKEWTDLQNPHKRHEYQFDEPLRAACDEFYYKNYIRWYTTEPFATANAQIPQVNIWDDHDIIDGFGSYTDHFMKCPVFRGIGGVALKYYCLFQHHIPPPLLSFVSDDPSTHHSKNQTAPSQNNPQLKDTFVLSNDSFSNHSSFILGTKPGPYVEDPSRSVYMRLGRRIAFLGLDGRTERTRHQVNYPQTYDKVMSRVSSELEAAGGSVKHLIVLLGVPIAYPRLVWLETIFSSPLMGGVRFLNKRFGVAEGLFNTFDGNVDLLDDLDDHYTARTHKKERKDLMHRLQEVSKKHQARITIVSGDVHLAAFGRFFSNPKLNIKPEHDHRYMANIVSSAITNKPPPKAVANLLAKRNKIHHLDHETDETLMNCWDKDPGDVKEVGAKTAASNLSTMPSRNFAIITETPERVHGEYNGLNHLQTSESHDFAPEHHHVSAAVKPYPKDTHFPITKGELLAGTKHKVASGLAAGDLPGGLDITYRVEINPKDEEGRTEGYGLSIPALFPSLSIPRVPGPLPPP